MQWTPPAHAVKVILGLGNPGRAYARTRHNVGWWVVDYLADDWKFGPWRAESGGGGGGAALVTSALVHGVTARLVKPQTFMNLSGAVLRPYMRRAHWSPATDLLVIVDDIALPVGQFRLRASGSSGGHNGLKSVEAALGTRDYPRLRVGIKPVDPQRDVGPLADFVLDACSAEERAAIVGLFPTIADAVDCVIRDGVVAAMNLYNTRPSGC